MNICSIIIFNKLINVKNQNYYIIFDVLVNIKSQNYILPKIIIV